MFNHKEYLNKFLQNNSFNLDLSKLSEPFPKLIHNPLTIPYYKCIGIHHMTPSENRGNHNIFVDVVDENGNRLNGTMLQIDHSQSGLPRGIMVIDKPDNEPGTNTHMGSNEVLSIYVLGLPSDKVTYLHTVHPDERGPNGELWNSIGHHSFYVVFQRVIEIIDEPDLTLREQILNLIRETNDQITIAANKRQFRLAYELSVMNRARREILKLMGE